MHISPNQKIKTLKRAREYVCVCVYLYSAQKKRVDLGWQWSTKLSYRRHQNGYFEAGEVSRRTGWTGRKNKRKPFFLCKEKVGQKERLTVCRHRMLPTFSPSPRVPLSGKVICVII